MSDNLQNCPHERRPGTTVCLHCRHAERQAARARRGRIFSHLMLAGAILGVVSVGVSAAVAALDGRPDAAAATLATAAPTVPVPSAATGAPEQAIATEVTAPARPTTVTQALAVSPAPAAPAPEPPPAAASLIPLVPEGTSPLADSMSVSRSGDTVLVHFDTELGRTRRPEKFDAIVRSTLEQIYGPAAERMLSSVAPGTLAGGGDLLAELPARGIRVPVGDGSTLAIWPATRPGRDGPLVVSYRAIVTP